MATKLTIPEVPLRDFLKGEKGGVKFSGLLDWRLGDTFHFRNFGQVGKSIFIPFFP